MTILYVSIAHWIHRVTDTHTEYVTRIAFPLQKWLHELNSMLHYTHIACLFIIRSPCKNDNTAIHLVCICSVNGQHMRQNICRRATSYCSNRKIIIETILNE